MGQEGPRENGPVVQPVAWVKYQGWEMAWHTLIIIILIIIIGNFLTRLTFCSLLYVSYCTQFTLVTTSHTTLLDVFSKHLRKGRRPIMLLIAICVFCYSIGLLICSQVYFSSLYGLNMKPCTSKFAHYMLQQWKMFVKGSALLSENDGYRQRELVLSNSEQLTTCHQWNEVLMLLKNILQCSMFRIHWF